MKPTNKNDTIQMTKLLNGYYAPTEFYEEVRAAVRAGLENAKPGKLYTCRGLCGEDYWIDLSKPEKWFAGRCLAHMVANRTFPLKFQQYKRSPTKRYHLI